MRGGGQRAAVQGRLPGDGPAAIWVVPQAAQAVLGEGLGWRWEETDLQEQRGPHARIRGYLVWRPTSGTIVRVLTLSSY